MSDLWFIFFLREPTGSGERARFVGRFSGIYAGLWAAGCWILDRAPASPAQGLHHHGPRYYISPYLCMT